MSRYVVLLRGINVGKNKRIAMADLMALLEGLGGTEVRTLLNSGNAVLTLAGRKTSASRAAIVKKALLDQHALDVAVIVKSAREFDAIVAGNPLATPKVDPTRLLVTFTQDAAATKALVALEPLVKPPEEFVVGPHAAYLHCASGILQSKAGEALLGKIGKQATSRNWATVLKLQALLAG